jgi:hypothetical protein
VNITDTTVRQVKLTDIMGSHSLDPIDIVLENFEPGKGRITIRCWGRAWTSYWGAMSGRSIDQFFCSCDEHYLAGCLASGLHEDRYSPERTAEAAKHEVLKRRRDFVRGVRSDAPALDAESAREIFDRIGDEVEESDAHLILPDAFGSEEWWHFTKSEPHPDYLYLCRVIKAAQDGLREFAKKGAQQ